jgi:hypothetical protein
MKVCRQVVPAVGIVAAVRKHKVDMLGWQIPERQLLALGC